jgi:outer membrane receptor protein involved in Fe transport
MQTNVARGEKMTNKYRAALLATTIVGFASFAAPATAQQAAAAAPATAAPQPSRDEVIVVTGSRIRRPNLESTVPITTIAGEAFFDQGQNSIGDTLNELPQLRSTFAQQNPGLGIGIAGLNLLDLRGLGTQRTLVLVNGRRHVPADILNNAVSVDTNSIPNDLLLRTDIVTGGNSAVYGSDAIAGVVNFVLRKSYEGLQIRARSGVSEDGYGANKYVSAMYGQKFADGRGNFIVHGEYAQSDRIYASDIKEFTNNNNYAIIDADGGAGIVNGGDGFFDRKFLTDIRSSTIHFNSLIPINQRNIPNAGRCGNATTANNGPPDTAGTAFNCTYFFSNDGRLTEQTGTRQGTGLNAVITGGNGATGREDATLSVLPFNERFNFNLISNYELTENSELFVEGKWNRVTAVGNNAGPSFLQGTGGTVDFRERVRLDNPFLNAADRTTLANLILASGCNTSLTVTCGAAGNLTAADITNINNGSYRFVISRNLLDAGLRDEEFQRDTFRIVAGVRGKFWGDWDYEISANLGKFTQESVQSGFIDRQRFALALDAGRNPVSGQIQCRSQFDAASAVPLVGFAGSSSVNAARLAADIAACVPYNAFGSPDNKASATYFTRPGGNTASLKQFIASGFVSGDSSALFKLQGGPIRGAVGAEYRQEDALFLQDDFLRDGFTNAVSIPDFIPKTFKVSEVFGELQFPILANLFLAQELTLSTAGRISRYQGSVGDVNSYNVGLDYAPVKDIRFRANLSRAVRAPNVSETGFPLVPNFFNGFIDPCNPAVIGTAVRAANCLAAVGATNLATFTNTNVSLPIVSGSNPNLTAETSDSKTYGFVFQPRFVPRFTLSADYYDITVNDVISTVPTQTLVNQCYDSATLDNVFCKQFTRWQGPGLGPLGEAPGRILGNSLISAPLNFAKRVRRGVDINASYKTTIGPVQLSTELIYTRVLENSNFQDPTNPTVETRVNGQLGDPKTEFRWDFDFGYKDFIFGYRTRYIGPMLYTLYAQSFSINGLPATDVDAFPLLKYPDISYHDIRFEYLWKREGKPELRFNAGIDNVLDEGVPEGATTATGAGSAIYSFGGRRLYAGVRARF